MYILLANIDYGDLRFQGGGNHGKLEFQLSDGTWGTVCSTGFNNGTAVVACKQLRYSNGSTIDMSQ